MILSGRARLAGVVGWPVGHSLSPRLHGYWLEDHGIDGAYLPLAVAPEHFETALRSLGDLGFRGVNVTIPHKRTALALCDEVAPLAARIGAVNTLVFDDGRLKGNNTDAFGFLENLRRGAPAWDPAAGPALILGAGGAARAVAVALLDAGVPELRLANRTAARAEALAEELGGQVTAVPWEGRGARGSGPLGDRRACRRHRPCAARDRACGARAGARQSGGQRARHAVAPGASWLRGLVWRRARGHRRTAQLRARGVTPCSCLA
jgi:shikimate dehydrogenase